MLDRRAFLSFAIAALAFPARATETLLLVPLPGAVEAPDFALPDLTDGVRRLSDHRGRPVLVAFWAVWCPPCRRELGTLAELRARVADTGIEVLAVNVRDSRERVADFLARHPAPGLPVLIDGTRATARAWHVQALPVAYAVDRLGILRLGAIGERDWRTPAIEQQLRSLV